MDFQCRVGEATEVFYTNPLRIPKADVGANTTDRGLVILRVVVSISREQARECRNLLTISCSAATAAAPPRARTSPASAMAVVRPETYAPRYVVGIALRARMPAGVSAGGTLPVAWHDLREPEGL
jgi:hypothetical protein